MCAACEEDSPNSLAAQDCCLFIIGSAQETKAKKKNANQETNDSGKDQGKPEKDKLKGKKQKKGGKTRKQYTINIPNDFLANTSCRSSACSLNATRHLKPPTLSNDSSSEFRQEMQKSKQ